MHCGSVESVHSVWIEFALVAFRFSWLPGRLAKLSEMLFGLVSFNTAEFAEGFAALPILQLWQLLILVPLGSAVACSDCDALP
jgi:hypothetical protein